MAEKYSEKLCDERHTTIEKRLKEIRLASWIIVALTICSLMAGNTQKGSEIKTTVIMKIFSIIGS